MLNIKSIIMRPAIVATVVLAALSTPWDGGVPARAQISGSSTGWCTDYEGNNFPCSDGGGGGGYSGGGGGYGYGGGCASPAYMNDSQIEAENARSFISIGDVQWDRGDYIGAADMYMSAVESNPANVTAHHNLAAALSYVGIDASDRGDYMSALLYHERSYQHWPEDKNIQGNVEDARYNAPGKTCSTCAKALMSDIAYGLGTSASIYSYVHQATANYDNCTRRLSCNDTSGASFRYLARQSCYQTYVGSEPGFRACLKQALEDNGWTFW